MLRNLFVKIFLAFVISAVFLSIAGYFFAKPILLSIANKGLHKISRQSRIADLKITPNFIEFHGIEINPYDIKIEKAEVHYTLRSIFDRKADFYIKAVNYNKLKIGDVTGKMELKGDILNINSILLSFLGGDVKGEFNISPGKDMNYNLSLRTHGLEIKRFVDDMKFKEKFDMTGKLDGEFSLTGRAGEIEDIKGDFHTDTSGGVLVIKDKAFLENIAKQSNQPLDIVVESFRNYNYNNGMIKLYMEGGNLILDAQLDGNAGKRNLTIVLHDFNKREERP